MMKNEMNEIGNVGKAYIAPRIQTVPLREESALLQTVSGTHNELVHENAAITDPDDGTDPLAG